MDIDLTSFDDIEVNPQVRVRLEHILADAEPGYRPTPGGGLSIDEVLAGSRPPTLFVGANRELGRALGIDLTRQKPRHTSTRSVCETAPTTLLLLFLNACWIYADQVEYRAARCSGEQLRSALNRVLQQGSVPVEIQPDQIVRLDIDEPTGDLEQKFGILLSPAAEADEFARLVQRVGGEDLPIAAVFFDIDHFKEINKRFTESVVDKTILPEVQHLVRRLAILRGSAFRHGGEEFLVLLPNHDMGEATAFAERLRRTIEQHSFMVGSEPFKLTISLGVAVWPAQASNCADLVGAANRAEHLAKDSGRNRVVAFDAKA